MRPSIFLTFLLLTFIISGCQYGEAFKTYEFADKWKIDYPPYLRKSTGVYPGAQFQAKNNYRGVATFLKEKNGVLDVTLFFDSLSTQLQSNLVDPVLELDSVYEINGTTFKTKHITGIIEDKRVFYLFSGIEMDGKLYHYSGWMPNDKRSLWQNDFEASLHSFQKK